MFKRRKSKRDIFKKEEKDVKPDILSTRIEDPWGEIDLSANLGFAVTKKVKDEDKIDKTWLDEQTMRQNMPKPPRKKFCKTSEVPAVEIPHAGYSYNPTFKDHQDLVQKAVEEVQEKIKKEQKITRATAIPKEAYVKDETKFEPDDDNEDEEDEEEKDEEKKQTPKARTRQKKRHEKEAKKREKEIRVMKEKKKRESEVFRVKSIQKELKSKERINKSRLAIKIEKKIQHEKFGPKRLSKYKFEEEPLNPNLSEELSDSLRGLKPKDTIGLLLERFKSLQKRNIVETRLRTGCKRKYRLKKFLRSSDKMEWEKTGVWEGFKLF